MCVGLSVVCVSLGRVPPGTIPTVDEARLTLATQWICLHGLPCPSDGRTRDDESSRICTCIRSHGLNVPMRLAYFSFELYFSIHEACSTVCPSTLQGVVCPLWSSFCTVLCTPRRTPLAISTAHFFQAEHLLCLFSLVFPSCYYSAGLLFG